MSESRHRIVQVICSDTGKSHDVWLEYKPLADEYKASCPCECGAAEYREWSEV